MIRRIEITIKKENKKRVNSNNTNEKIELQ